MGGIGLGLNGLRGQVNGEIARESQSEGADCEKGNDSK